MKSCTKYRLGPFHATLGKPPVQDRGEGAGGMVLDASADIVHTAHRLSHEANPEKDLSNFILLFETGGVSQAALRVDGHQSTIPPRRCCPEAMMSKHAPTECVRLTKSLRNALFSAAVKAFDSRTARMTSWYSCTAGFLSRSLTCANTDTDRRKFSNLCVR